MKWFTVYNRWNVFHETKIVPKCSQARCNLLCGNLFCLPFVFFQSIRENVIVDSHQTLIQYFCTNVFFLFACPIINLSKNGKNCIANLRFLRFLLIILKAVSNLDTTEQNHDINNISARFLKHKILKMNGVSLPTVAWVKKGSC